jgi:very-short-patch-repair endonuclease/DNA polymerase III delta prime subunit
MNATADPALAEQALRLFEFLGRAQRLKASSPASVESYRRDGMVLWLAEAPEHEAVRCAYSGGDPQPGDPLLVIDRVPKTDPAQPGEELAPWLAGPLDDPGREPQLRREIPAAEAETELRRIEDFPEIPQRYRDWLVGWRAWAERELADRPVREYYTELFQARGTAVGRPEEFELVAGVGLLAWAPEGHPQVKRHVFTCPATIEFEEDTARLSVVAAESSETLRTEDDMLDPGLIPTPESMEAIRDDARELEAHPLHRAEVGALARRLVHSLDAEGAYRDEEAAPAPGTDAVIAYAPAIILRKRSQQGLVHIFETIAEQIRQTGEVPDGVVPLIDPDHEPAIAETSADGAVFSVDDEPFLPMPVNDKQLRIVRAVDKQAQVLVQGPPGTGKTHTAAALLSHLLAQGQRVLVTAHTDRALSEVREKLPDEIKPLAVSVVGSSRDEMAELKTAVAEIAAAAHEHNPTANALVMRRCEEVIEAQRRSRAEGNHKLLAAREREVREHERGGYRGTLAAIARAHQANAEEYGWLADYARVGADHPAPLSTREVTEWHGHLTDTALAAEEPEAAMRLIELGTVATPEQFANLVAGEQHAGEAQSEHEAAKAHPAYEPVRQLAPSHREALRSRLQSLAAEAGTLAGGRQPWIGDALAAARSGRGRQWQARENRVADLTARATGPVTRLGTLTEVSLPEEETGRIESLARAVQHYLAEGGEIKTAFDGTPKIGRFADKRLKAAGLLFERVRVDGLAPTNLSQVDAVLAWIDARRTLAALDREWLQDVPVPAESTLHERLQWHEAEHDQLRRTLALGDELAAEDARLVEIGLPAPDWSDLSAVQDYAGVVDAAAAEDTWAAAAEPLRALELAVEEPARWTGASSTTGAAPATAALRAAIAERDRDGYAAAHLRLSRLWQAREDIRRRDELGAKLAATAPALAEAVRADPADEAWKGRLARFEDAWAWAAVGTWIREHETADVNALQGAVSRAEERIREQVGALAARRAWDHAASPERLGGRARADLTQYAQLVARLGKGTGKYAAARRAEIQRAMDRCRPSVPVWIMPLYRIAEQLSVEPDMFDVVIVDEASQAGMEATFLQYLAKKIVVIGDDKQVSPAAVGIDQQQLRDLAAQYLAADRYRASWQDPGRSLFDEAKMRYGGLVTLTEHRRCVPEIIGFSNRIAYEPDGVRLQPVRQYGADRLEPIKAMYLSDGYARGTTNRVNPVEVEAVAVQVEKCIADPAYDGKTFGMISLLGTAQAKRIETELLERISPEEWEARELRCGDAAAFQGAERDVMFLSMVAAPEPGRRIAALTAEMYVQRYNVAVSRAKDQVWVFHSVPRAELTNHDDMRYALLDYCYGVIERGSSETTGASTRPVPEDEPVPPFDSLFEQRVHNRLIDRGYTVLPQYEALGYYIDLVVVGGRARLAVECDGDAWHGPAEFERDLGRQRELERCGWRFHRVRESAFYTDAAGTLRALWDTLEELDIHPAGGLEVEPAPPPEEPLPAAVPVPEQAEDLVSREPVGKLPQPLPARAEVITQLAEIVAVEGPVPGGRLHAIYLRTSGLEPGARVTKLLNSSLTAAVAKGVLLAEDPRRTREAKAKTYRLPGQQEPVVRAEPGPRGPSRTEIVARLADVVAVAGPTVGSQLHNIYLQNSGHEPGARMTKLLNSSLTAAVAMGVLVADDPHALHAAEPKSYSLPSGQSPRSNRQPT